MKKTISFLVSFLIVLSVFTSPFSCVYAVEADALESQEAIADVSSGNKYTEGDRYVPEYEICGTVSWSLQNGSTVPAKCIKVQLLNASNSVMATTYTNENGYYSFVGIFSESFYASVKVLPENSYGC